MDTLTAIANNMAANARGGRGQVFDWHKAARLIRQYGAKNAGAGLGGDWEWTGGEILRDGRPLASNESYTYLASMWATPEIEIDGVKMPCGTPNTPEGNPEKWNENTRWPESALAILRGEGA